MQSGRKSRKRGQKSKKVQIFVLILLSRVAGMLNCYKTY